MYNYITINEKSNLFDRIRSKFLNPTKKNHLDAIADNMIFWEVLKLSQRYSNLDDEPNNLGFKVVAKITTCSSSLTSEDIESKFDKAVEKYHALISPNVEKLKELFNRTLNPIINSLDPDEVLFDFTNDPSLIYKFWIGNITKIIFEVSEEDKCNISVALTIIENGKIVDSDLGSVEEMIRQIAEHINLNQKNTILCTHPTYTLQGQNMHCLTHA